MRHEGLIALLAHIEHDQSLMDIHLGRGEPDALAAYMVSSMSSAK